MRAITPFLKDAWRLARPYFMESEEKWSARGLLAAIVALNLIMVGMTVVLSYWRNEFYNALQDKNWEVFIDLLFTYRDTPSGLMPGFCGLAAALIAISVYQVYLNQWLQIRWRTWMTTVFLEQWMSDRAYYRIGLTNEHSAVGTDNPDQRIAEDLREFCQETLSLSLGLLSKVVSLISFAGILWGLSGAFEIWGISIPGYMFWVAVVYAIVGSIFTHLVGRPLASLNFRQQRVEADFRYALVRVRENTEGIALYRGEAEEKGNLLHRFGAVIGNWRAIMARTKLLNTLIVGYEQVAVIFPVVVAAPRYFSGGIQLGGLMQTIGAFGQVENALSWFVSAYASLASWRAVVERLTTFSSAVAGARASANGGFTRVESADGTVQLRNVTLNLPNGTHLLENADLVLTPNQSVVFSGRSGSGKSTVFRMLAGIWPFGQGQVAIPPNALFIPQRPYIPLGTLRHVVAYPHAPAVYAQTDIAQALVAAGLGHLIDHLDQDDNWTQRLSGGEQQRIALARALLAKPDWIFLDEATASLDPEAEAELYATLRERLPNTTLVSIAHRPSVAELHDRKIVLRRDATSTRAGAGTFVTGD